MAEDKTREPRVADRSLTGSAAVDVALHLMNGAAAGAGGAVGVHVVNQVLHRPPKEESPTVVLPLGVPKE